MQLCCGRRGVEADVAKVQHQVAKAFIERVKGVVGAFPGQEKRTQTPQTRVRKAIFHKKHTPKNQKLISHRSDSDVCELVLLIFFGSFGGFQTPCQGGGTKKLFVLDAGRTLQSGQV